jgi:DNA-binding response OmpR family regulator
MSRSRILAVMEPGTDSNACKELSEYYDVACTQTLRPTLRQIEDFDPDLILIDIDDNTLSKTKRITQAARAHYRRPFVILIKSGRAAPEGISYYDKLLSKPFVFKKLKTTIDELIASRPSYVIQLPPFTLDTRTQVLDCPNGKVRLNPKMSKLMETFLLNAGQPVSSLTLMKEVWKISRIQDIRTLHVHIHWLRAIIEENVSDPQFLKTVSRQKGYILDLPGQLTIGGEPLYAPVST